MLLPVGMCGFTWLTGPLAVLYQGSPLVTRNLFQHTQSNIATSNSNGFLSAAWSLTAAIVCASPLSTCTSGKGNIMPASTRGDALASQRMSVADIETL